MGKPDIWMPLYIGDYLAATAHLEAEESGAYLHLLMHSWKNGALPTDLESLRRIAKVPKDAWSNAWRVLIPFFDFAEDGTPSQGRLERIRAEWAAKQVKSKDKARKAAESRWSKADAPSIQYDAPSIPQAMLEPCPSPSPSPVKTKPSRAKKPRERPTKTELTEKRHAEFKELIFGEWKLWGNPLDTPPWDGAEGMQLAMMLKANPKLGLDGMRRLLQHRGRSEGVNLAARPSKWLRSITDYAKGPLDPYGKPKMNGNGHIPPRPPDNTLAELRERTARAVAEVAAEAARAN